jgi:hypothetical protein
MGVHVKLPGWIKSAVEFVKLPAGPRQVDPPPDAPHPIDSRAPPQDASPREIEIPPESRIEVGHESQVNIEQVSIEQVSIESEHRIKIESEGRIDVESDGSPNQQEIDRRRGIVRAFFNDYWSSADDKPTSFAERLDRAEGYINERVAAGGEAWRLGPATRKQLGLPPSKKA